MFTKNGHNIVKLFIEFSNWVCDISKTCITKQIYTKIFYFIDPMYWFTIDMYSTDRGIVHAGEKDHARHGWTTSIRGQDSPRKSQSE